MVEFKLVLRAERRSVVFEIEAGEFLADDLHAGGRTRKPAVDRQQRHHCIQLLAGRAVLDRPANVRAQPVLDAALRDQRSDDDQAAVTQREDVFRGPSGAGGVNRLLGEPLAEALREPHGHLFARDSELRRVGVETALVPVGDRAHRASIKLPVASVAVT